MKKLIAGLLALTALALGGWAWEARASRDLDATMASEVRPLLPGGRVDTVQVTDDPALLAAHRARIEQILAAGRTADGRPVTMIVREYDRAAHRAQSVSWQLGGLGFAPGWRPARDDAGACVDRATAQVDGRRVDVVARAQVDGRGLTMSPGAITVDGIGVPIEGAPPAVRQSLASVTTAVPLPPATTAAVRSVCFDDDGLAVELYARDARG